MPPASYSASMLVAALPPRCQFHVRSFRRSMALRCLSGTTRSSRKKILSPFHLLAEAANERTRLPSGVTGLDSTVRVAR